MLTSTKNSGYIQTFTGTTIYDQVIYTDMQLDTIKEFLNILMRIMKEISWYSRKKALLGDLAWGFDVGFTYYPQKNKQLTQSSRCWLFRIVKMSSPIPTQGVYQYEE
jgi:hypothetical protein